MMNSELWRKFAVDALASDIAMLYSSTDFAALLQHSFAVRRTCSIRYSKASMPCVLPPEECARNWLL